MRLLRRRPVLGVAVLSVIATAVGIAIVLAIDWFPTQGASAAGDVDHLYDVLLIASVPIFVLVMSVAIYSVLAFRVKPGEMHDGEPIHGNTRLEVIWTAAPAILIVGLITYAYVVLRDIEQAPARPAAERHVRVIGEQFTWTFEYEVEGGKKVRSGQLYLPVDESVMFDVVSKDVIHDFWVPAFRMKIDAVPGITTHYRVTPTRLGAYPVVCAELCGLGHAFMRQTAHVVTPERFQAWLAKQGAPAPGAAPGGPAIDAKRLFTQGNSLGATPCAACHTLADAGSKSQTGPDLDQALANRDAAFVRESIINPNAEIASGFAPNIMPRNYADTLSPEELKALVDYLVRVTQK